MPPLIKSEQPEVKGEFGEFGEFVEPPPGPPTESPEMPTESPEIRRGPSRTSKRTRTAGYGRSSSPVAPARAVRKEDGSWATWVLSYSAKERNTVIKDYGLTEDEVSDLKKSSRRMKQMLAQRRYMAGMREKISST